MAPPAAPLRPWYQSLRYRQDGDDDWNAVLAQVQDEHETPEPYAFNLFDEGPQPDLEWVLVDNNDEADPQDQPTASTNDTPATVNNSNPLTTADASSEAEQQSQQTASADDSPTADDIDSERQRQDQQTASANDTLTTVDTGGDGAAHVESQRSSNKRKRANSNEQATELERAQFSTQDQEAFRARDARMRQFLAAGRWRSRPSNTAVPVYQHTSANPPMPSYTQPHQPTSLNLIALFNPMAPYDPHAPVYTHTATQYYRLAPPYMATQQHMLTQQHVPQQYPPSYPYPARPLSHNQRLYDERMRQQSEAARRAQDQSRPLDT